MLSPYTCVYSLSTHLPTYLYCTGTIDMQEAENEWVLRPYMNAAKKRTVL